MNRTRKAAALTGIAVAGTIAWSGSPQERAQAAGLGRELWGAVTIVPGREGTVEVTGYQGAPLGAGSVLTLTAPEGAEVADAPLDAHGFRGAVASDRGSGTYTFDEGVATRAWQGRTFPFVLSVPRDAVPGTRLSGCAVRLTEAGGAVRDEGTCAVTVGLPEPALTRPESGVPLLALPKASGTAFPGAQVTVRDGEENEVCATTATAKGAWSCVPSVALPTGSGRLQVTASFNGVSAVSEQIAITVGAVGR
ncbi:carboxypeptidase regulatory-like domain-containing protein [Streptomyces sp. NPDC050997]|uniref:carboxypeptidase regulatory-like domain-containing protein n=1 Tax=Streptomyces sp. NPDC050997 TaxID=3155519 RepID=UPI0034400F24